MRTKKLSDISCQSVIKNSNFPLFYALFVGGTGPILRLKNRMPIAECESVECQLRQALALILKPETLKLEPLYN